MHKVIEPKILYFGTPVVLISTRNEDGSPNLVPNVFGMVAEPIVYAGNE